MLVELEIFKPAPQIILLEPACATRVHIEEELLEKQPLGVLYKNGRNKGQETFFIEHEFIFITTHFEFSEGLKDILNGCLPFSNIFKPFLKVFSLLNI